VEVVVEVPRFSFVKRTPRGDVDFVSPLPCPVNYGSVPNTTAADGDPLDAVVMGPRLSRGARRSVPVRGVILFVDAGQKDDKLVCKLAPLTVRDRALLLSFFHLYALAKSGLNAARGRRGATRCLGFRAETG
jgi:inorganic pyrophosphatase